EPLPALLRVVDRDDRPAVGRRPRGVEALSLRKTAALGMHRGDRRVVLLLGAACEPVHDSVRHSPLLPFGSGADHDASDSETCLSLLDSASRRYWCTNAMAMLPSPTAAATRFTGPERTSPHAKMPGTLVSSRYGSRSSCHRPASRTSAPVSTKPRPSRAISGGSHAVSASAPMNRNRPPDSIRVVSPVAELRTSIASSDASPYAPVTSVENRTSMFVRAASWLMR